MFEATMTQVVVLRKIVESLKDLVTEVNIEATPTGNSYSNFRTLTASHGLRARLTCVTPTQRIRL